MTFKIYESRYKDIASVTIENDYLTAVFLPEFGGKMASFRNKGTGEEYLAQAENESYKVLEYDGSYVDSECSGFDDMFPAIDRYFYADYPWKGVEVPDHGEVCGLRWDWDKEANCLHMSVNGVRFPYRMEKWIRFTSENELGIVYKVTSLSSFDMDFIWAAHAIINADEEGGEILLPYGSGSDITCTFSRDEGFSAYGGKMKWPEAIRRDGRSQKLNETMARNENGNNYKVFFDERISEGWCGYRYNSTGTVLKLEFPPEKVPYMALWVSEGSFKGYHSVALEPCTGTYDRCDLAKMHDQNSVLKAKSEYSWFINLKVERS